MKPKLNRFLTPRWTSAITLACAILASNPSHAATLNWDGANAGGTDDVASGGTGNWNTALSWDDGLVNSLNASWNNGTPDSAVFGGAAGTVTVSAVTTAGSITFNTAGYTLNNTSNLTAGTLAGSGSFTKTGAGDLIFNVGSSFTGGLTVTGGRVFFNNPVATTYQLGSLTTGNDILVDNASTLQLNSGVLNFGNTNFWMQTTGIGSGATTAALGKITSGTGTLTVTNAVPDYNSITDQAIRLQIVDGPGAVQLVKNGGGALRIDRANTYTGGTVVNGGKLELQGVGTLGAGAVTVNTGGQVQFSGTSASYANNFTLSGVGSTETAGQLGALRFGSNTATITGTVTLASDTRIGADATGIISGVISGGFGFEKTRGGTLTLSGANTYSGATTVSAGILSLDYDTQDNSKIAGALIMTHGTTLQLSGALGTHSEALGSFSSSGVTTIARNGANTAVIELGNFTNTGLLNVGALGLATTTKLNNAAGYLTGVLLAGTDLATNSGGNVIAFTGYNDVTRLASGAKVITSGANTVTRIIEGTGAAANITVNAGTTDIQSLLQTATGAATVVDLTGGILRLGASGEILSGVGSQALTIQGGSLTAGGAVDTAGEVFVGAGGGAITITSGIANNGLGAVSLRTAGTVNVTGDANLFSGGTTVTGGTLTATATTTAGAKTTLGAGAINVNNGTIRFSTGSTGNALSYANAINLTNGTLSSNDGVVTYGGLVSLTGVNTLNAVFAGKNAIFSNTISGSGSIIKNGAGDVILNGNNTYTGGTNFNGGSLQVGNAGALGVSGALTFTGGTLKHSAANTTDYSSRFSTAGAQAYSVDTNGQNVTWATGLTSLGGSLTKLGTGTLTLTGMNTYNGATFIRNGTVSVGSIANNLGTATSAITLGTSVSTTGTLLYTGAGETAARGLILNGNGVVTNNGAGLLRFTGTVTNNAASGTQSLTLGGSNNGELTGVISNNAAVSTTSLIKADAGTWTLSGISTFTGGTTVNNGTLILNAGGGAGAIRGTATVNTGAFLQLNAGDATGFTAATALNVINLTGGTMHVNTVSNQTLGSAVINMTGGNITGIAGSNLDFFGGASALNTLASSTTSVISGVSISALRQGNTTFTVADGGAAIDLRIDSVMRNSPAGDAVGGVLTKAGAGLMQLTGVNTFTGNIAITGGILELGGAGVLGSGNSAQNINNTAAFVSNSTANQTLSGVISGTGTVKKSNSSILTLTGANTYTGTTTVSSGTLLVNGSLANTTTTVESGGTLGGGGSIGGFTTILSGGRLSPGNSPGVIAFSNGLELQAGGHLDWQFVGNALATRGTDYDGVNVIGGVFTLGNGGLLNLLATGTNYADAAWDVNRTFKVVDVTGAGTYNAAGAFTLDTTGAGAFAGEGSWSVSYDPTGVTLNWLVIPEPSAALLGGLGLLLTLRRRRLA